MVGVKRFFAVLMVASGLLVAGGVNAANVASATYSCTNPSTISPTTVTGAVGDTFTVQNLGGQGCPVTIANTAVVTGSNLSFPSSTNTYTLASIGTTTVNFVGNTITVTVTAPSASAVPTLSEWSQMLLGLIMMATLGWYFHKRQEL